MLFLFVSTMGDSASSQMPKIVARRFLSKMIRTSLTVVMIVGGLYQFCGACWHKTHRRGHGIISQKVKDILPTHTTKKSC